MIRAAVKTFLNPWPKFVVTPTLRPGTELREIGAKYKRGTGVWVLPYLRSSIIELYRLYGEDSVQLDEYSRQLVSTPWGNSPIPKQQILDRLSSIGLVSDTVVQDYQIEAIQFLLSSPHSGNLLALSPGLGKTLVSLIAAKLLGLDRVLIIAPKSLMVNWQNEARKWFDQTVPISWKSDPPETGWTITNYDTVVGSTYGAGYTGAWDLVIVDESLLLKNHQTQRWIRLSKLRSQWARLWLLSGNPISRYPDDLFAQLRLLMPKNFTSYWRFARTYCLLENTPWGTTISGTDPTKNVTQDHSDLIFVKHQKDVLDLPPLLFEEITLGLTNPEQAELYQSMVTDFLMVLETGEELTATSRLSQIGRLRQCLSTPRNFGPTWPTSSVKLEALENLISLQSIETPAIIWVQWSETASVLGDLLDSLGQTYGVVTGNTDQNDETLQKFQRADIDFLVLSLGVGKYGHTLTSAKSVVYYDTTWDADAHIQSLARVQRLGLTHSPVVYTLFVEGSVDDLVRSILARKMPGIAQITNADLAYLLRGLHYDV